MMARYKENIQGIDFDIQVNTESGLIRILSEGITASGVYNKAKGALGKLEIHFDSLDRMDAGTALLSELMKREAAKYFAS